MSELFGDERGKPRRKRRIVVRCGSCGEREGTITLAQSGLRRCRQCFEAMGLEPKHARKVVPQPELDGVRTVPTSQPFASVGSLAAKSEFKKLAAGGEE